MKHTETGMIPDDWEVKEFGRYVSIVRGGSPRPIQNFLTTNMDGINWIKIGDVNPGDKYIVSTEEKIIPEGKIHSREVHKGDFLLSNSMSFGRPYILQIDGCIHDGWLAIQKYSETFDRDFLFYLLGSEAIQKQYISMAAGSSVQNLNKEKVAKLLLPVPPTMEEQQKIAKVLGNIDNTINALEKLIEKKKNIKQAAMQQLLAGTKRLPGFASSVAIKQTPIGPIPVDWEVININKCCTIKARIGWQGLKSNEYLKTGKYVLITGTDFDNGFINWKLCNYVTKWRFEQDKNIQIRKGDILITKDGTIGKVAFLNKIPMQGTLNSGIFVIRPRNLNKIDTVFLSLVFKSFWFDNFLEQIMSGSTIVHLYQKDFVKFNFPVPCIKEQIAISRILSDMDSEISALEQKLAKYRSLKAAIASQLLTGKIRLV
jgi:type I restriction enzyme S subunit